MLKGEQIYILPATMAIINQSHYPPPLPGSPTIFIYAPHTSINAFDRAPFLGAIFLITLQSYGDSCLMVFLRANIIRWRGMGVDKMPSE